MSTETDQHSSDATDIDDTRAAWKRLAEHYEGEPVGDLAEAALQSMEDNIS